MKDGKKQHKKLTLRKETIRVLTGDELAQVAGGAPPTTTAPGCGFSTLLCIFKSRIFCPPTTTAPGCGTTTD
jgi:hypothetical protein